MSDFPVLHKKFNIHVQNKIKNALNNIINARFGFVQSESIQYLFKSTEPLFKNTTNIIKKTEEITKYKYAGGHR